MDSYDNNLYSNLRLRMEGKNSNVPKYVHDEESETEMITDLNAYRAAAKELYMRSLLNPEAHLAKVPSRMPVESATAALRYNFTITPNATGKFCLVIDPYYSSGYLYQDVTVNGLGAGVVTPISFPQDGALIDQWRLVSSSLILKYYGNFNQMSGLYVAATTANVSAAVATTYLTFSNVEDLTNKQVLKCIDGAKLIYSPMDEKATEFQNVASYTGGTHPCRWQYLFVVVGDLFPNAGFIRCDFFRNIEYTSTPTYKEYITQTKDLPNDPVIPRIQPTVRSAPKDFTGKTSDNETWEDEIKKLASTTFKDVRNTGMKVLMENVVGPALKSYNPFGSGFEKMGFNLMKTMK